jgi:Fibronectin type III domain
MRLLFILLTLMPISAWAVTPCPADRDNAAPARTALADDSHAQPFGGTLRILIPLQTVSAPNVKVSLCIRQAPRPGAGTIPKWLPVPFTLPPAPNDAGNVVLTATIPEIPIDISPFSVAWISVLGVPVPHISLFPRMEARVVVIGDQPNAQPAIDETMTFWITFKPLSFLVAILAVTIFWGVMARIARKRGIAGNWILRVISNRSGYASLSQFQVVLWTATVGVSAIYVMSLTARLIDIPTETLGLLGIAGVATVTARAKSIDTSPGGPSGGDPPTSVLDPQVFGSVGATAASLTWRDPMGGGDVDDILIEYRAAGTSNWTQAGHTVSAPYRVTGLTAGTTYDFQITPRNRFGPGPSAIIGRVAMNGADTPIALAPTEVMARPAAFPMTGLTVTWTWTGVPVDMFGVMIRENGSAAWTQAGTVPGGQTAMVIRDLAQNTTYDIKVYAWTGPARGPESPIVTASTVPRVPNPGDLVVWDGTNEISITRLQMLFFTLIAVSFVLLRVLQDNEIPKIPEGILLLMTLSNGVYLAPKFLPNRT